MITADEVKRAARNKGFPAGVVEKDYALTWLLYGIYNSELKDVLAFKGGTALSKVYFPKFWRLSEDLDFTLTKEIQPQEIESLLENGLNLLNEKTGMNFNIASFHCKFKKIKPDYEMFFDETKLNEARDFWGKGLGRLMKEVPVFDTIIADLRKELEFLK